MMALSSWIASSVSLASIAVLTRLINKLAVSLRRGEPERPDAAFDEFGAFVVGRGLERLEQPVEILHLVAALHARQRARRLGWLERLGIQCLRKCRNEPGDDRDDRQCACNKTAHGRNLTLHRGTIKTILHAMRTADSQFRRHGVFWLFCALAAQRCGAGRPQHAVVNLGAP